MALLPARHSFLHPNRLLLPSSSLLCRLTIRTLSTCVGHRQSLPQSKRLASTYQVCHEVREETQDAISIRFCLSYCLIRPRIFGALNLRSLSTSAELFGSPSLLGHLRQTRTQSKGHEEGPAS
ncbi:hypothetical protein CROQUDRAFT_652236 [Cronartium quercuum f. sp. fusiforme G11]|uniref:Uncharacterized protein n=1 Tax=Cronartium quercuum f. sp. fusiforme G11 TaxID=708437 RepID=A0A9P6NRE8_9BASI|nr:hypothetical protein CROQUDRAFT_652236 [Cronartium quercuum f. sp. fusiforme G11]